MKTNWIGAVLCLISTVSMPVVITAQSTAANTDKGFTSYVEFDGTTNSAGQEYVLNSNVGYIFTQHFGMDIGLPFYFATTAATATTASTSGSGVGNPVLNLRWKFPSESLN